MSIVEGCAASFTSEFYHVAVLVVLDFEDFSSNLSRNCSRRGRLFLEILAKVLIHLGRLNRSLDSVGNFPEFVIHTKVIDDFTRAYDRSQPVKQIWNGNFSLNEGAAGDFLTTDVRVKTQCDDTTIFDLLSLFFFLFPLPP